GYVARILGLMPGAGDVSGGWLAVRLVKWGAVPNAAASATAVRRTAHGLQGAASAAPCSPFASGRRPLRPVGGGRPVRAAEDHVGRLHVANTERLVIEVR